MISHKHKCIFIHIPKTAGSSIERALMQSSGEFRFFKPEDFNVEKLPPHVYGYNGINRWDIKHLPARFLKDSYNDYFKFCFVRNPWDLVVSCYFWWIQQTKMEFRKLQGKLLEKIGFTNYAVSCYTDYINEIFHCGMGQCYWIMDEDNKTAIVDYIGHFENLQEDFNTVCEIVGIEKIQLATVNKSEHKPFYEYYDDTVAKLIEYKYMWDVKRFGYTLKDKGA